jgi:hypothetical protein
MKSYKKPIKTISALTAKSYIFERIIKEYPPPVPIHREKLNRSPLNKHNESIHSHYHQSVIIH